MHSNFDSKFEWLDRYLASGLAAAWPRPDVRTQEYLAETLFRPLNETAKEVPKNEFGKSGTLFH